MMEMREGKGNKGVPSKSPQQRIIMRGIGFASGLAALGLWGLAAYVWFLQDGRMPAFLLFIIGLVMAGLAWYAFGKSRPISKLMFKNELRGDGYATFLINRRSAAARELFIPYNRMKEVLLVKTARYQVQPDNRPGDYRISANLIMKWTDKSGRAQYAVFQVDERDQLEQGIELLSQNGIPLYASDDFIAPMPAEDYKRIYPQIAKHMYDASQDSQIGYSEPHQPAFWRSQLKPAASSAKPVFHVVGAWGYAALFAVNGLAGWLWIPDWRIETSGDTFVETSWILAFFAANILLFLIFGGYWRKGSNWYRPLLDSFLVLAAQSLGLVIALAGTNQMSLYWNALVVDGVAFAAYLTGAYLFTRFVLSRWL